MSFPSHLSTLVSRALCVLFLIAVASAQTEDKARMRDSVVRDHAALVCHGYERSLAAARAFQAAVERFLEAPDEKTLAAARKGWVAARRFYGRTEVFRFYDGPIDNGRNGVEALLNAWPVDESTIDSVRGREGAGIINDLERYPTLNPFVLCFANERGGESNVSVGWHAAEFLLWGQDFDPAGPGRRSSDDYRVGKGKNAERRREYLRIVSKLIVQHLGQVHAAWAPKSGSYRARFEKEGDEAVRKILTGMVILSGFEMSGERLAVAYETGDQEQEHSCFSDTSERDLIANQEGIIAVYRGVTLGEKKPLRGLRSLARLCDREVADDVDQKLDASLAALKAIPRPFDQTIRAKKGSPARQKLLAAITALEAQAEALATLGLVLGFDLPLQPGG